MWNPLRSAASFVTPQESASIRGSLYLICPRATIQSPTGGGVFPSQPFPRLVNRDGSPGSLELYETVVRVNLVGTFNMLRLAAARMAAAEPVEDERGVCVLTASTAAYEGQIGQVPYA